MLKLYKLCDGIRRYRETEHWGTVGEEGETREHIVPRQADPDRFILALLRPAADEGFCPIEDSEHIILLIEYRIVAFGTRLDLDMRHALEKRMDQTLGWSGLGRCDGGSSGSGTMEVCCLVVDFDIAKRIIIEDLKDTEFSDYARSFQQE
jgi:hypothetical protein